MENIEKQITIGDKWLTQNFLILNAAIKQHFIYKLLVKNEIEPSFAKTQELVNFITDNQKSKTGKTLSITNNLWLFVSNKYTYLVHADNYKKIEGEIEINSTGTYTLEDVYHFSMIENNEKPDKFPKAIQKSAYINLNEVKFPLTLRTRRNGDIIQPFGMQGKMKLKKYFINKNIPEHDRDKILLLCKDKEVLWAIGVGLSEKLRSKDIPKYRLELEITDND